MPPINTGDRKELGKLLQSRAAGDQVLATRIDRLARSMFELFAIERGSEKCNHSSTSSAKEVRLMYRFCQFPIADRPNGPKN
jgi:DNA invertase Pin-like site-specific DNA recombinase